MVSACNLLHRGILLIGIYSFRLLLLWSDLIEFTSLQQSESV